MRGGGSWLPLLALMIALYLLAFGLAGLAHLIRHRLARRRRRLADDTGHHLDENHPGI